MREVFEEHTGTSQLQDAALATFDNFIDPFSTTTNGLERAVSEHFSPVSPEEVVISDNLSAQKGQFKSFGHTKKRFLLCATN